MHGQRQPQKYARGPCGTEKTRIFHMVESFVAWLVCHVCPIWMLLCAVGHRRNILLYNGKLPAAPVRTVHYILRPFRRASGLPHEPANAPMEMRIAAGPIAVSGPRLRSTVR